MMHWVIRLALAVFLAVMASAKITSGYREEYALPAGLFYASVGFEALAAGLLLSGRWRLASQLLVGFFGLAAIGSMVFDGKCGCGGELFLENRFIRMLAAGAGGICAVLLLSKSNAKAAAS